jgi:hypothetical protein
MLTGANSRLDGTIVATDKVAERSKAVTSLCWIVEGWKVEADLVALDSIAQLSKTGAMR